MSKTLKQRKWYAYNTAKRVTRVSKVWNSPLSLVSVDEKGHFKLEAIAPAFVTSQHGVGVSKVIARLVQHVPRYRLLAYYATLSHEFVAQLEANMTMGGIWSAPAGLSRATDWIESYNPANSGENNG